MGAWKSPSNQKDLLTPGDVVSAWKSSGQSARAYGRLHGLEPWQLYAWQAQQKRRCGSGRAEPVPATGRFLSLNWSPPVQAAEAATVTLRHAGLEFIIAGVREPVEIAGLLRAIRREVLDV
ncbi:MAG: hypothetical protein JJT96_20585 [Opitutales bacterium]|nr:hypothetical protein [Opitutales bacterium]